MLAGVLTIGVVVALLFSPVGLELMASRRERRRDLRAEAQTDWWPAFERDFRAYVRRRRRLERLSPISERIRRVGM